MNVSDVVMEFLEKKGIGKIFLLSGGGIMYLLDALGKREKLGYVCNYHEQASAIAADGYSRMNGFGVCLATFGPGAVNALSGVVGAWYDSIPMLVISGQVRSNLIADYSKVRQVGPQEGNVLEMVKPVTKYAVSLRDPNKILYELEKCYKVAKSGRPGPVWLELPLDMQSAEVEESNLLPWIDEDGKTAEHGLNGKLLQIVAALKSAKRPVLLLGNGVRLSGMHEEMLSIIRQLEIPVLIPYTGKDLLENQNEFSFGVFGTAGQRHANLILQNSDLLIGMGVGFCVAKTGFETAKFAPRAYKIFVDVDHGQLNSHPLKADVQIQMDLADFLPALSNVLKEYAPRHEEWVNLSRNWKDKYPIVPKELFADCGSINSYVFMSMLSERAANEDVIVTGNGLDCVSFYQAFNLKKGQRAALNGNWGSMGWDIPTAIGATYATNKRILCITGDGGVMLNIQELVGVGSERLPIKLFIFNNDGYGSIKATQDNLFESRYVGSNPSSGVHNPDFESLAKAFKIPYFVATEHSELGKVLDQVLGIDGPAICEIKVSSEQWITPKASSFRNAEGKLESKPLDDMFPFLPAAEIEENRQMALAVK
jgi:acetolactate synthase-1/2/3 large subunit